MKRITATAAVVALAAAGLIGTAGASNAAGNGTIVKECFGASYGKTGLNYGQLKKDPAHPLDGGYGVPGVLAAHGPDGAISLCS